MGPGSDYYACEWSTPNTLADAGKKSPYSFYEKPRENYVVIARTLILPCPQKHYPVNCDQRRYKIHSKSLAVPLWLYIPARHPQWLQPVTGKDFLSQKRVSSCI